MKKQTKVRTNVMFPREVLELLRSLVPVRERSDFVAEATAYKLRLLRQQRAIEAAVGAWKDEDHPDLMTEEDLRRWRQHFEEDWDERWARLFGDPRDESGNVSP